MFIRLTPSEMMTAAHIGIMRQVQNLKKLRIDAYGAKTNLGWQIHIEGAMGECAVAKALGCYWSGAIGVLNAGDVGEVQVRTTTHKNGRLILHKLDPLNCYYVLAIGENGEYEMAGYLWGKNGMNDKHWEDPTGTNRFAYFVPREELTDFSLLR